MLEKTVWLYVLSVKSGRTFLTLIVRDHSFSTQAKFFEKLNFPENFANVLNEWSLMIFFFNYMNWHKLFLFWNRSVSFMVLLPLMKIRRKFSSKVVCSSKKFWRKSSAFSDYVGDLFDSSYLGDCNFTDIDLKLIST